jgi:hypothetical protein
VFWSAAAPLGVVVLPIELVPEVVPAWPLVDGFCAPTAVEPELVELSGVVVVVVVSGVVPVVLWV